MLLSANAAHEKRVGPWKGQPFAVRLPGVNAGPHASTAPLTFKQTDVALGQRWLVGVMKHTLR